MKLFFRLTIASILLFSVSSKAQDAAFVWANSIGGNAVFCRQSVLDPSGNVYITGSFYNSPPDFDPGPGVFTLNTAGVNDAFIAKYDTLGNFIWAKQIGSSGNDDGLALTVDASGNLIATGVIDGHTDLDPGPGVFDPFFTGQHAYILKLNPAGDFVWAKVIGSGIDINTRSVVTDAAGDIYLTGMFRGTVDFNPGNATYNMTTGVMGTSRDIYALKLSANGNFSWACMVGGIYVDRPYAMALDNASGMYITGTFEGTVDFDPGSGVNNVTALGDPTFNRSDAYILKLNTAAGQFQWVATASGDRTIIGRAITVDDAGNIVATGDFTSGFGSVDFKLGNSTYHSILSGGEKFGYIWKLTPAGGLVWVKAVGGYAPEMNSVTTDQNNNIYVGGDFTGTGNFDPGTGTHNLVSLGDKDAFLAQYDASGNLVWAKRFGGGSPDYITDIEVDQTGDIISSGTIFSGVFDFDPGPGVFNATAGTGNRAFIHKMTPSLSLPVHISQFTATLLPGDEVKLNWLTVSETDMSHYTIYHSSDALHWEEVCSTAASNKGQEAVTYTCIDKQPFAGHTFYQLKSTEGTGKSEYSKVIDVFTGSIAEDVVSLAPNPVTDHVTIRFSGSKKESHITLHDLNGRFIQGIASENNTAVLDVSALPAGTYYIKISTADGLHTKKMVKH